MQYYIGLSGKRAVNRELNFYDGCGQDLPSIASGPKFDRYGMIMTLLECRRMGELYGWQAGAPPLLIKAKVYKDFLAEQ